MRAEIWIPGQPLGTLPADKVAEIQGTYTGPLVAVLDDEDGIMIIQPMNPDTGNNWGSEDEALAFAERYMTPPPLVAQTTNGNEPDPEEIGHPSTE